MRVRSFHLGRVRRAAMGGALATLLALGAGADTIILRSAARVDAGQSVLLRDVALLEGAYANELGDLEIVGAADLQAERSVQIDIDQVRDAIRAARPNARFGALAFSGDRCAVRQHRAPAPAEEPALARPAATVQTTSINWRTASDLRDATVRSALASRLASFLKAEPADVRLAFSEGDDPLLNLSGEGRILDIQPTGLGAQVPVMVRVFEGDRLAAAGTVRVRVEQRREIVAARESLKRGDVVASERVIIESRWVTPGERYASPDGAVDMVVKNRLEPGQVLVEADVEPAVVIRRGDICTIACLSGSIVLNVRARALANGREGETIEFTPVANLRARVRARVLAAGQAVINATPADDHVFGGGQADTKNEPPISRSEPRATESATVGTIQVQRVTERPDGSFVVEAKTPHGKRPIKRMKFLPLDE